MRAGMIPTRENVDRYCNLLYLDVARYGGIPEDGPIVRNVFETAVAAKDTEVLWRLALPTSDIALEVGIDLLTNGGEVRIWKLRKQIDRWEVLVSAPMLPTDQNISQFEQNLAKYIDTFGGKLTYLGYRTFPDISENNP